MKEEGVKKVNMSILETEIDLITSIKNDFAIFENSSDLPVNHTAAVLALNADCNNQKQWRKNHQKQHRKDEVKASFYRTLGNFHSKMITEKDR